MGYLRLPVAFTSPGAFLSLAHEEAFLVLKSRVNYNLSQQSPYLNEFIFGERPTINEKFSAAVVDQITKLGP